MEEWFKQKLLSFRNGSKSSSFEGELYGPLDELFVSSSEISPNDQNPVQKLTEKKIVFDSLERFAQEKLAEKSVIEVEGGGVITQKKELGWPLLKAASSWEELSLGLSVERSALDLCLAGKKASEVKVLFVTESFRSCNDFEVELTQTFVDQLLPAFPIKTAEYFSRMILAMKLEHKEVCIYPSEFRDVDISDEVARIASFFSPEVIITLGAKASHAVLKIQERLTLIHGQFFDRKLGAQNVTVVPLFHPSIIENNLNMKKTAWEDMQKIMKLLKKLP